MTTRIETALIDAKIATPCLVLDRKQIAKNYKDAEISLLNIVKDEKNDFYPHQLLGIVYSKLGDLNKAISHFEISFKINPSSLGSLDLILIAFSIAFGNLQGWAVASTILLPFRLTLSKAPYPIAL